MGKDMLLVLGRRSRGSNHYHWKGGRIKRGKYWHIYKPNHPFVTKGGYVREHRLIYELFYNCILLPYTLIHHINGNTEDNRIENLEPCYRKTHTSIHNPKRDTSKRFCLRCGGKTVVHKKGWEVWHKYNDGFICKNCYLRKYRKSKKW